jgi:hypothetical protein
LILSPDPTSAVLLHLFLLPLAFEYFLVIKRCAQVFTSYGPRSNRELLRDYGFVLACNHHFSISLPFPGIQTDEDGKGYDPWLSSCLHL